MSKIVDAFLERCDSDATKTAMIYSEKGELCYKTYAQLNVDVEVMAGYIAACGAKKGDRILAFAQPSYKLCVFMLAALVSGVAVMYVDIYAKQETLKKVISDYKPGLILVSNKTRWLRRGFAGIRDIRGVVNIDKVRELAGNSTLATIGTMEEDDLALLTMTTGSTGKPKIALRTHGQLFEQLKLIKDNLDTDSSDEVVFTTSYIYVFANLINGFTTVLPQLNLAKSAKKINKKIGVFREVPVSVIITSPDFCLKAVNIFERLKVLYFGGAILNLHEAEKIAEKFSCSDNIVIYGSTECNLMCKVNLKKYIAVLKERHMAPLGFPVKGVDLKLAENGEITVSSDALLGKYLIDYQGNKSTDESGVLRHHTNDMAFRDENGMFLYLGKSSNFVVINGQKIYSNEIEQNIIANLKCIPKCAVLQKDDIIYVCVEKCGACKKEIYDLMHSAYHTDHVKVIRLRNIPCDVKHHTKINYRKLMKKARLYGKI